MNLKQFKYVLTLANEGNFGKAADVLNISQPSLSQYIKKIEQQLGAELFDRNGGSVRLTDAGQVYIEAGRKILDLEHRMHNRLHDLAEYKDGSIIVGTSPYRSAAMMPLVVKAFREKYPGMHIVVEEMMTTKLLEATEHGQLDLCVTMLPLDKRKFNYEIITEEELLLAVPASFSAMPAKQMKDRKYWAVDAECLDHQSFVMITEGQPMQQLLDNLCRDYHLSLQKAAVVKSLEAQIAMVRAGVGMALVPAGIERFCSSDEVIFYSLAQSLPKREVVVMWRRDQQPNRAGRELLHIMKEIAW